jgi:hypothetical protein
MSYSLFLPSIISSLVEVSITQPLDVIKTHSQAKKMDQLKYNFKSLYKGFVPRALGNIPSRTVFLFSQDYLKYNLDKKYHPVILPIIAGTAQTVVDTPVEILKMNQIFDIKNKSYFAGFIPHCFRNIIFIGFVFNMKEYAKNKHNSIEAMALYGAMGAVIGSYISHPLDTLKTIKQSNSKIQLKSFKDYYKGVHLRAGMGFINMGISLSVFELLKIFWVFKQY